MADGDNNSKKYGLIAALGCGGLLILIILIGAILLTFLPLPVMRNTQAAPEENTPVPGQVATQEVVATLPSNDDNTQGTSSFSGAELTSLYNGVNPGVVNIRVYVEQQGQQGQGAGSGFVLDDDGHIVTNNHVIAQAEFVTVIYYDGLEAEAEIIGTDADSDLAVIKVDQLPDDVTPLVLGDSDTVEIGEQVIAIGNPFGLGSSLTLGIVSAVGRTISSGTPFAIPQAIQTDAAINPGNSGGPLLNSDGEVIGVNAQIASAGARANAGVGFAIPANVVRRISPVLIETGSFAWPWLGIRGGSVDLFIMRANDFPSQQGAYIHEVIEDGPADRAGLQGSTDTTTVEGFEGVPVGGDVVLEIDGQSIQSYSDLLYEISQRDPGATITLLILRDGEEQELNVELEARPESS